MQHRGPKPLAWSACAALVAAALVASACSGSGTRSERASADSATTDAGTGVSMGEPPPLPYDTDAGLVGGDPLVVQTPSGPVQGATAESTRQFLGIPYAAAPTGDLRWRAPQPAEPWTQPLDATTPPPSCPQTFPVVDISTGQEDCLYLNVEAPAEPAEDLVPVMVWIHGGAFTLGSANDNPPSQIVERSGVIVVSINYRLGPLGFLAHPDLEAEDPESGLGNFGFLDQVAALQWVQDSIATFGGDPRNVTVFGESAGGMSVCGHLMSPRSTGLFQRAIIQSGPCTQAGLHEEVTVPQSEELARALGCETAGDQVACLRGKDARAVLEALPGDPTFLFRDAAFWMPTADDVVLPRDLDAVIEAGDFNQVPVIAGITRDEGRLFMGMAAHTDGALIDPVTPATYEQRAASYFGDEVGAEVVAQYPLEDYPGASEALGQAVGDATLACSTLHGAQALAPTVPVYLYQYEHEPNPFVLPMTGIELGAFHSAELPYVFGGSVQSSGPIAFTPDQQVLSDTVVDAWTRFARTGDPAGEGLAWPEAGDDARYLVLDTPVEQGEGLGDEVCGFWSETGWDARDAGRE
jgi:para-nitrobenzyl esterase